MKVVTSFRSALFVIAVAGASLAGAEGHHWSYGKHGGPAEWGELDQAFASCRLGKVQSPIDIRDAKATDLPAITLQQIEHFFSHYKDLEPGKWVKVIGWGDAAEARRLISEAIARAKA